MGRPREEFKDLLDTFGATVYGQEPGNTGMDTPCIIYKENLEDVVHADNVPYDITDRYSVTIIEADPTRPIAKAVRQLPMCTFNRRFEAENLIHTVYHIYF